MCATRCASFSRRSLTRWKNEVEPFKAELRRRREYLIDEHGDRFRAMVGKSLDVMDEHLESRWAPTCHRAARTILSLTGLGKAIGIKPDAKPTSDKSPASETPAPAAPSGTAELKPMSLSTAKALLKAVNAVNLYGGFTGASRAGSSGPLPLAG
jgi:hypothetical protein